MVTIQHAESDALGFHELRTAASLGDAEATRLLAERIMPSLLHTAETLQVKDPQGLVQRVVIRAFANIKRFKGPEHRFIETLERVVQKLAERERERDNSFTTTHGDDSKVYVDPQPTIRVTDWPDLPPPPNSRMAAALALQETFEAQPNGDVPTPTQGNEAGLKLFPNPAPTKQPPTKPKIGPDKAEQELRFSQQPTRQLLTTKTPLSSSPSMTKKAGKPKLDDSGETFLATDHILLIVGAALLLIPLLVITILFTGRSEANNESSTQAIVAYDARQPAGFHSTVVIEL